MSDTNPKTLYFACPMCTQGPSRRLKPSSRPSCDTSRIAMTEAADLLRPIFTDDKLLINTGMVDFTKPWVEQVHFEFKDEIRQAPDGTFYPVGVLRGLQLLSSAYLPRCASARHEPRQGGLRTLGNGGR